MKALVNIGPGKLALLDRKLPQPGPGQVLIRTLACGICATDLEMIRGWDRTGFPAVPGHEWCGRVEALGKGAPRALLGKKCVGYNVWAGGGEVGFEHPGGYAQCFVTEAAGLVALPESLPADTAVLIEPLATCTRALKRLGLEDFSRALVVGDGPIGILLAFLLRRAGVQEIRQVGGVRERLKASEKLSGAGTLLVRPGTGDTVRAMGRRFGGGFANVLEASGSAAGMEAALALCARGGRLLVLGDYRKATAGFPWNDLLHRELTLIGSNASADAWGEAAKTALASKRMLAPLVTHRLQMGDYARGFELVRTRRAIKVVLRWSNEP